MSHIHAQIDFVVSAVIVHDRRVLLVNHKALGTWLPPGGHIELHETPDDALRREIREETGLAPDEYTIVRTTGDVLAENAYAAMDPEKNHHARPLVTPWCVEVHDYPPLLGHRHVAFVYLVLARHGVVLLEADAHHAIRWFTANELHEARWGLLDTVRLYGLHALERSDVLEWVGSRRGPVS